MNEQDTIIVSIGIDGASLDLLQRMVNEEEMPFFAELIEHGCLGTLRSIPPITYPAWYVLLSGQEPGEIGVYDFVKFDRKRKTVDIVTPYDFKAPNIGDILSRHKVRFAIINTPSIVPRPGRQYYGYIVGDPLLPRPKYYPRFLRTTLKILGYMNYDPLLSKSFIHTLSEEEIAQRAKRLIESRFKLAKYLLLRDHEIRFLHLTIFVIDNIQHFFWDSRLLRDIWRYLDYQLRQLLNVVAKTRKKWTLFIVSDHGFSKAYCVLNLGGIFVKTGYTKVRTGAYIISKLGLDRRRLARILKGGIPRSVSMCPETLISKMLKLIPQDARKGDALTSLNIPESRVISHGMCSIYINCADNNEQYEELIHEIKELLNALRDPVRKTPLVRVIESKKVFKGRYVNDAPDLMVIPERGVYIVNEYLNIHEIARKPIAGEDWVASHTTDATLIAYAPFADLKKLGRIKAQLEDYAPTILRLLNIDTESLTLSGSPILKLLENLMV